ncbi:MAG: glycine-rich domain-containing protein-like [Spirulina sp.]
MSNFGYCHLASLLDSTLKYSQTHVVQDPQHGDRVEQMLAQLEGGVLQEKLAQLDLGSVATSLHSTRGQGWSARQTHLAIVRYLFFLFLCYLHPSQILVPPKDVDLVWHEHLLQDTRKYTRDCEMLFDGFVHHAQQSQLWDNAVEENAQIAYQQTRLLFDRYLQGTSNTSGENLARELLSRETPQQEKEHGACGHPV